MEANVRTRWDISWRDADEWQHAVAMLSSFFRTRTDDAQPLRLAALRVKMLIDAIDSFIQEQTAVVCPWCTDVCCIDRHGAFDLHDLIYAFALDLPLPHYSHDHREIDPCRFLDASGCRLVRWQRPFRCTWHFCDALIKHMHNLPAKKVRGFNAAFQELLAARAEMLTAFEHIVQKRKQQHH